MTKKSPTTAHETFIYQQVGGAYFYKLQRTLHLCAAAFNFVYRMDSVVNDLRLKDEDKDKDL